MTDSTREPRMPGSDERANADAWIPVRTEDVRAQPLPLTLYKSATITRLTGYSPLLLRAWERRHRLLCPVRGPGGHRLYTDDDLAVLKRVRNYLCAGYSIGEVAALGRSALLAESDEVVRAGARPSARSPQPSGERGPFPSRVADFQDQLEAAACSFESDRVRQLIEDCCDTMGEELTFCTVLRPLLERIGLAWDCGQMSVGAENLLSDAFRLRLLQAIETCRRGRERAQRPVVVACVAPERHDLGILCLALSLERTRIPVLFLGPAIPVSEVERACRLLAPPAACLSFKRTCTLQEAAPALQDLARAHASTRFVIGGDGVNAPRCFEEDNVYWLEGAGVEAAISLVTPQI